MSSRTYTLLEDASLDVVERAQYYLEDATDEVMLRFVRAVLATAALLADFPLVGTRCRLRDPKLRDMRRHPVRGFAGILIFYLPVPEGVVICRVLDSKRDWQRFFS